MYADADCDRVVTLALTDSFKDASLRSTSAKFELLTDTPAQHQDVKMHQI
jgi:hypothetical protein